MNEDHTELRELLEADLAQAIDRCEHARTNFNFWLRELREAERAQARAADYLGTMRDPSSAP